MEIKTVAKESLKTLNQEASRLLHSYVIGPMEKGFEAAKLQTPPAHVVDGVDLRVLPKFICYKAALLREKVALQFWLAILATAFLVVFLGSRWEVYRLNTKLRAKEYILAPGVQDFIAVSPQSVPDSHVQNAAMEFLQTFGNFSPTNIEEQYRRLTDSMSPDLRVQFELEAAPWRAKVKDEGIAQILSITEKEIRSSGDGYYHVTAIGRKDSFVNNEHIGATDIVIEMVLKLIPPQAGRRWYLEIEKLVSQDANAFRVKSKMSVPPPKPSVEGSR
ncbi:hypothetical protein WDW37_10510 [Bdellovibrionota bacterium FG-1]